MGKLEGRVAVVTGGGQGIGRGIAELFAAEGAKVVIATRSSGPGKETVDAITAAGGDAYLITCDVGDRAACSAAISEAADHYGQLDILVHNAAYVPYAPLGELDDKDLDKMFDVGLKAAFWLTNDALPHLEKSRAARILLTSSGAGNGAGVIGLVHYGALKAGINGFVRGAALELARRGITVNAVQPGLILTPAGQRMSSAERHAAMASSIPIPRLGLPLDVAHGFLYLASEEANYVTGHILQVDGGVLLGRIDGPKFN